MATYLIDLRADSAGGNAVAGVTDVVIRTDSESNPNPIAPLDTDLKNLIHGKDVLFGTHGFHVDRANGIANLGLGGVAATWTEWRICWSALARRFPLGALHRLSGGRK